MTENIDISKFPILRIKNKNKTWLWDFSHFPIEYLLKLCAQHSWKKLKKYIGSREYMKWEQQGRMEIDIGDPSGLRK